MHNSREYLKNVPFYFISSVFTKLLAFILLPIYANVLDAEQLGLISIYESAARIIIIFTSLYLDTAFLRFYFDYREKKRSELQIFFSTHFIFLASWGVILGTLIIFILLLYNSSFKEIRLNVIVMIVIYQIINQLYFLVSGIWQAELKSKAVSIANILFSLTGFTFTLGALLWFNSDWEGRFISIFCVSLIQMMFVMYYCLRRSLLVFNFDYKVIKESLRYSIPLMPNIAAGWIAMFSDRIILGWYGDLGQVGIYSVAAQITLSLYLINDAFSKVNGPLSYSELQTNKVKAAESISSYFHFIIILMTVLYISLNLIAPVLIRVFFDVTYLDAIKIIMIIGFTFIFSAIYRIFTVILSYEKRNWIISIGAILQAVINLILNLMFIPNFGIFAAAASTSISLLVYALFLCYHAQGYLKLKINPRFLFLVICLALTHICLLILEWFDIINTLTVNSGGIIIIVCLLFLYQATFPSNFVNMLRKK